MADRPELEAPELDVDEGAGRFKRLVAIGVVLITFFGSIIAYVQAVESNKEDVAAREAAQEAIIGLGDQVNASARLASDLQIGSSVDAQRQREVLSAARVRALDDEELSAEAVADRELFAGIAEVLATLAVADPADPATFEAEAAQLNETPDEARLRQAVSADRANDHGDKADSYVAVLTVLAVALFLLGLSLTVQGRSRLVLAGPGVVIAIACVAWSAVIATGDITRVSGSAITAAAEGQRLQDAGDLEGAIDAYDEAIENSPEFAAAFARRSSAQFLAGSPQAGQTAFQSITSDEALEAALADLDRALELGADSDVATVAEGGFLRFLDGDFEGSIDLSEQALEQNARLSPVWFNLGVANVALGNEDEAERAYRQGFRVLDDFPDEGQQSAILAGARTDLSVLRELLDGDELEDVEDLIEDAEVALASFEMDLTNCGIAGACTDSVEAGDVELVDPVFTTSGAFVQVSVGVEGLDEQTPVGAAWFFRPDDSLPFQQTVLSFETVPVDTGFVGYTTLAILDPPCPVAGEYLLRLYTQEEFLGELTTTIEPTLAGNDFLAFSDPVEGFVGCQPAGFEVDRGELGNLDSFTTFAGEDFQIGVNVTPGAVPPGADPQEFILGTLDGLLPGAAPPEPIPLSANDLDGGFLFLDGFFIIDEAEGAAFAAAAGPDSSTRLVLLTGDVSEELLFDAVRLITFTGVGTA